MHADAHPDGAPTPGSTPDPGAPPSTAPAHPAILDRWVERVAALLDLPAQDVDVALVLDLARDAAHGIARPAAPLTTFLLGLAVGRADHGAGDARRLAAEITAEITAEIDRLRDPVDAVAVEDHAVGGGADRPRAADVPGVHGSDAGDRA